jgi:hypothetical protein
MLPIPKSHTIELSIYNPGDGRRYQMEVMDDYKLVCSFPRNHHISKKEFDFYLDGFEAALSKIEDIKFDKAYARKQKKENTNG